MYGVCAFGWPDLHYQTILLAIQIRIHSSKTIVETYYEQLTADTHSLTQQNATTTEKKPNSKLYRWALNNIQILSNMILECMCITNMHFCYHK